MPLLADFDGAPIRFALTVATVVALGTVAGQGDEAEDTGARPVTSGHRV